jgi:metal-dependent amidase/aminoacylase/carboxypeptidase family protein
MTPSMGGEDFAYFLEQVPGSFARLGAMQPGDSHPTGLHTSTLRIDESCMETGVAYYLHLIQRFGERFKEET